MESMDVPASKVSVLPIAGIDTNRYRVFETDLTESGTRIATVGRVTDEKGYDDLLRCARELGPEYQFHAAGDGERRAELEERAPKNVEFHGTIPNDQIPEFLNRGDLYFQPSKTEGLCMTVIEAMACELPVVGSSVGGITESVVDGETGFLCEPGDIDCFRRRIEQLSQDPQLRGEMGAAGRERVVLNYSSAELVKRFREAIE
jgi:glycosyltransferase involved in cell wall biosynthesis